MDFTERSTRVYKTKQLYSKEELAARESLCVHEQPAFCTAACPLRIDARRARADSARPGTSLRREPRWNVQCHLHKYWQQAAKRPAQTPAVWQSAGAESVSIPARWSAPPCGTDSRRTGRGLLKFKKKKTAVVFGAELFTLVVAAELAGKSYPTTVLCR